MAVFGIKMVQIMVTMALILAISLDKTFASDTILELDAGVCVADLHSSTNNTFGSSVTSANVEKSPGLNRLAVSLARLAPGGINPPHTHPQATEMIFVLEGELDVGFITTANMLVSKHIRKGEVFIVPKGLVHFQKNNGKVSAAVISAFNNSQLPGTHKSIAPTLFEASPDVPDDVLAQTFHTKY